MEPLVSNRDPGLTRHLQHHETTQAFIRSLEFLAPSVHAIEAMRAHPTYSAFERRWQLPVYFQLRWKEIVNKLEVALSVTRLETAVKTGSFCDQIQQSSLFMGFCRPGSLRDTSGRCGMGSDHDMLEC